MKRLTRVAVAGLLLALPLAGLAAQADDVRVHAPKLRVMPGTSPAGGYLELVNQGAEPVVLRATGTAAYQSGAVHESLEVDGQSRMEHRDSVRLAPGESLVFQPGGYHLMFMQRQEELAVGDQVPVWFEFDDGSRLTVDFDVVPPTYR